MAIEINMDNFDAAVLKADKPVLVDFWAPWCGPCRMLAPVLDEVAAAHEGQVTIAKVNVDDCPDLAMKFGVVSIPTLILFKDGQIVDKRVGYQPKKAVEDMIQKAF